MKAPTKNRPFCGASARERWRIGKEWLLKVAVAGVIVIFFRPGHEPLLCPCGLLHPVSGPDAQYSDLSGQW